MKYKKCDDCGKESKDVQTVCCPVSMFNDGKYVEITVCDSCYEVRINDRNNLIRGTK